MKVVLLGASGAGKTTLAKIIAEKTGLNYISNSAGGIMPHAYKSLLHREYGFEGGQGQLAVLQYSHDNPHFGMLFQRGVLEGRKAILQKPEPMILDRSPLDPFVFFLNQLSHAFGDEVAEDLRNVCMETLHYHCDAFIKVDLVVPDKEITKEEGAGRIANWYFQKKIDKLFNVAIHEYWDWCKERELSPRPWYRIKEWDLDGRIKDTLKFLDTIK